MNYAYFLNFDDSIAFSFENSLFLMFTLCGKDVNTVIWLPLFFDLTDSSKVDNISNDSLDFLGVL